MAEAPDWTSDLSPLDTDGLRDISDDLQPLFDEIDYDDESEYQGLTVADDVSYLSKRREVTYLDLLKVKLAADHIKRLPNEGEAIHMVLSGRYQLFHTIPAVLELAAPATIDTLHFCTLSYSKDNAADLLELIDAGKIKHSILLVSHYFSKTSPHLFDPLAAALRQMGHQVLTCRSHAKIFLFKLSDGRKYVIHSSANARSCKSIEQACFECSDALYDFHAGWIQGLFTAAASKPSEKPDGPQSHANENQGDAG